MKRKKSKELKTKFLIASISVITLLYLVFFWSPFHNEDTVVVNIYPADTQEQVIQKLAEAGEVKHSALLAVFLNVVHYKKKIHPGHYTIPPGMSILRLVRVLRSGLQTPVRLTFNNIRTVEELAGKLSMQLMTDSVALLTCLQDTVWIESMGLNRTNYLCVFLPNTYEVYWNTTPESLLELFQKEYHRFWNASRLEEAKANGLTPAEVSTLASIVEEETNKPDEMPKVAGLYLNRLHINMPLQADPTVKFAVGDFTLKRILKEHTRMVSPYNTYRNVGLPPGPIRLPSIRAIEAVLKPVCHSYLYMCAKDDFSGYHAFATTLAEHNANASAYHDALNKHGILQ